MCHCTNTVKNSPAATLPYFSFVHESIIFINYFYTTVTNSDKKIFPTAGFRSSCLSISFTIPLIICVRLRQIHYLSANCDKSCQKKFRLRRAFRTPIFLFRQFLAPPRNLFLPTPLQEGTGTSKSEFEQKKVVKIFCDRQRGSSKSEFEQKKGRRHFL